MNFYFRFYGFFFNAGRLFNKRKTGITLAKTANIIIIKPKIYGFYISLHIPFKKLPEPRIILNHQGYDYYVKSGQAVFPEQPHKVKPSIIMTSLILEENDSIRFGYSVYWIWKNNTFVIASGGSPWLFHWLDDEGTDCGIQ